MPRLYRLFFLPMTLIIALGIGSCKTPNQITIPNPEFRLIKNIPNALVEAPPSTELSKNNKIGLELKRIFPKLATLQNLNSNQVLDLLGTPNFKRTDKPAEVWQYSANSCTLDLFLYENLDTDVRSVVHYEVRLKPGQIITKNQCFEIVIKSSTQTS